MLKALELPVSSVTISEFFTASAVNTELFFSIGEEVWIGLDNIYKLTNSGTPMKLRVDLEKFDGTKASAFYEDFRLVDQVIGQILIIK